MSLVVVDLPYQIYCQIDDALLDCNRETVSLRRGNMRKKLFSTLFLLVFVFCTAAFAADEKKERISDLTPWLGHSLSILTLYQGKAAETFFAEVKKHAPEGYTIEMIKDFIYKQFSLKFTSLHIVDEDTITIDNKMTGDYAYVGSITTTWKDQKTKITWEIFKTDSKEMIEAGFKYFLFVPFHQHGVMTFAEVQWQDLLAAQVTGGTHMDAIKIWSPMLHSS